MFSQALINQCDIFIFLKQITTLCEWTEVEKGGK